MADQSAQEAEDRLGPSEELLRVFTEATERGANLLLDVGPDKEGRIPAYSEQVLMRLRREARL